MRCLFFVVFVYAVRCEDGNYYVIQVPRNEPQRTLKVYWNVPTMQCKSKKVPFEDLYRKYGIHQNDGDQFRGEMVTIMYDPGLFPALLKNETSGKFKFRNGGVPQEGDLDKHLEAFRKDLDLSIPDHNFKGIGIIDFESWRPIYRQNFGVLSPYKDVSYEIERKLHWWWTKPSLEAEAKRRFESSARTFMESTITLARQLRPGGVWGFYGFPYCFNMASNNMVEGCANKVPQENDRLSWLWRSSTALYPSVYSPASLSTSQLAALIRGRVQEARRVKRGVVLPYFWYRYRDGGFLRQNDLDAALHELYKSNASGFIIWGSSSDVNTVDKCKKLYNYINNVFGPAVAKYTKKSLRDEVMDENNNTRVDINNTDANNNVTIEPNNRTVAEDTDISNELHTVDKRNSTDDVKKDVQHDIIKKFTNYVPINEDNTSEEEEAVLKNNNVLIDLIINSILNKEFNSLSNNNNNNESTTEYNLLNATNESSLITKNNVENNTGLVVNNNFSNINQSGTTDESIFSTTEPIKIISIDDIQTIDYTNSESHKETTQKDLTTEYNLNNDMSSERSVIENDLTSETAVTNSFDKARDFNFDANDSTDNLFLRTLGIIDISTTKSIKSTAELEDIYFNEFLNTFSESEITTTETTLKKGSKEDTSRRLNRNKSEFNETRNEFTNETEFKANGTKSTKKINQTDVTAESHYYFDSSNGSNSVDILRNSETFTTESQNISTNSNSKDDNQETTTHFADFDKTLTTSTEYYDVFDETTVTSTISLIKDKSDSLIEHSTEIVNGQEILNYANSFDTTATPMAEVEGSKKFTDHSTNIVNSQETTNYATLDITTSATLMVENSNNLIEDRTIVNNQETTNYSNFDETSASPKAEIKSSTEDSTAVSATEDKVVVYVML